MSHPLATWHSEYWRKKMSIQVPRKVKYLVIGSGASGIACGVIRNFYFQPAMGEVIRVSVEVWESDPEAFHYHGVGYMALVSDVQAAEVDSIYERQQRGGYRSSLICGEENVFNY